MSFDMESWLWLLVVCFEPINSGRPLLNVVMRTVLGPFRQPCAIGSS